MLIRSILAATAFAAFALPATAHVTLERDEAAPGERYMAVLRVGHGCAGSPTTAISVKIPETITSAQPMPKAGWDIEIIRTPLAEPVASGHGEITERVSEIHWTGGSLPEDYYDEFVFRVRMPESPGATLYFPVVQDCDDGMHRWIEIPDEGRAADDLPEPAPAVVLTN